MADNLTIPVATDDVAGVHYQKIKLFDAVPDSTTGLNVYTEDAAAGGGETGIVVLGVRKDANTTPVSTDGDFHTLVFDANGNLKVNVISGNSAATQYTEDGASAGGESMILAGAIRRDTAAVGSGTDGDYSTINVDASGRLWVTPQTSGDVAHDSADSGNPVKLGGKATNALSGLTLVAAADRTDFFAGLDGVQIVRNHCNLEDIVSGNASNTDGSSTQVIAAAGAGIKQYLTSVTLTNMSATNIYVEIKSGSTVRWTFPCPANAGGVTLTFDPPLPPNAANEAWNFDPSAAATTVYCSMNGFKSKV